VPLARSDANRRDIRADAIAVCIEVVWAMTVTRGARQSGTPHIRHRGPGTSGATIWPTVAMTKRRERSTGSSKGERVTADARFAAVVAALAGKRDVTRESRQGFGSGALKVNGKIFAMMTPRAEFVVKIPKARVDELVSDGIGERFEPGPGRIMKEWLALAGHSQLWVNLDNEASQLVN